MDNRVMHKLSYGLFVISAKSDTKTNGCIINTVMQVTSQPLRIVTALNKANYTHDLIAESKEFNISILDESVPFDIFKCFGFRCGRKCDKFSGVDFELAANGLPYLSKYANAYMSCKVVEITDLGTHSLFLADVVAGEVLSDVEAVTYAYYHKYIKTGAPAPAGGKTSAKTLWRCTVCGFEYEGEELPEGYVCPVCHQPSTVFEKIVKETVAQQVWKCTVCGYEHSGEIAGDFLCPVCKQGGHVFVPKDQPDAKTAWRCKICNFIYEEKILPPDYICPLCKHPVADFEKIIV
jgi:flavin reductase (DIM6/NTAB) family NADH-FMN oxidoreductase RutF/rubredoxin